jgi:4-amino-4-deoxy-L-arabinose transferase-like glycosyltransferase
MARAGLAAVIVVMCAVDVVWIRQNTAPPRMFDDTFYLIESVDLYRTLQEQGLVKFLEDSTIHSRRGHPPMMKILPVFAYLFLGPGTNAALYVYTVLIAVFALYLFLLARELLDSEAKALLAVVITCLFPITYGMWRHVMAEFGIAVVTVGCLYHLRKSQELRHAGHAVAVGFFVGCGLLWKVTFPVFVGPAIALVLIRAPRPLRKRGIWLAVLTALVVAGPFYARSWVPVVAFTLAAAGPGAQRLWGLGPVLSPATIARYWLLLINWGITPYYFGLFVVSLLVWLFRKRVASMTRDTPFLTAWFVPAFTLLTFHPLKEVRHLLPALPVVAIVTAALITDLVSPLRRGLQAVAVGALMIWPMYQFASWSFDSPLVPRLDLRSGPIMLSMKNLEAESLEWMPTFTYPANPRRWPSREAVALMEGHRISSDERARVHVAGTNPYFNALILMHEARLTRSSFVFDPPFTSDYADADFVVTVLATRRYGPVDQRPTAAERELKGAAAPFTLVGTLPLPDGGDAQIYEADRRIRLRRLNQ